MMQGSAIVQSLLAFRGFNLQVIAIIAVICAFLGNLQSAVIISRGFFHDDIRGYGSGNAGATNMFRVYGIYAGVATFFFDALKCVVGCFIGRVIAMKLGINSGFDAQLGTYIGGLFVIIGHCYPICYGFKGGKGAASSLGFIWVAFPLGAAVTTALSVGIFLVSRRMSVVSITGAFIFAILTFLFFMANPYLCLFAVLDTVLVLIRHKDNIKRLIKGQEKPLIDPIVK